LDEEQAESENRRHPDTDKDSVQLVVDGTVIRKVEPNTEDEAGKSGEQDGNSKNHDWFHEMTVTHGPRQAADTM
jgi:hypothetical protein